MTDAFLSAHAYACARRTLDICEGYLGRSTIWHFEPAVERLEIIPYIAGWDNAQSGNGFLELGETDPRDPRTFFAYSFDSIAHEIGHLVLLAELGAPIDEGRPKDYFAYHESIADFISLLGLLHFDTALDRILRRTKGNLLIHNELDRFAEISSESQVRVLNNSLRQHDVGGEVHDRSKPFAAALFDCLVEAYQLLLFERGLTDIDPRQYHDLRREMPSRQINEHLRIPKERYETRHFASKAALQEARDFVGESLFNSWSLLEPDDLTFEAAAAAFLRSANEGRAARFASQFEDCMNWRDIIQWQWRTT